METTTSSPHELLRLKLSETNTPEPDSLMAELYRGTESLMRWSCPLPAASTSPARSVEAARQPAPDPARRQAAPSPLESRLRSIAPFVDPDDVLWIELARPKGCLTTLPWECWLSPMLRRPVLRVPRFPFKPIRPSGGLHIAYCSSAAVAKGPFDVVGLLLANCETLVRAGLDVTFHVFLDVHERARLEAAAVERQVSAYLRLHVPPPELAESPREPSRGGDPLASPWLRWIASALPARGVDVVHFVNHGYLARGRGAIALARHPVDDDDRTIARFVYADELTRLLDVAGASGVVLTSPPGNYSVSGLLALADELIGCRPGPVVFHDAERDTSSDELARALAFLYGDGPPPVSGALAVCAHPDRLRAPTAIEPAGESGGAPSEATPAEWTQLYRAPTLDPARITSSEAYRKVLATYTLAQRVQDIPVPVAGAPTLGLPNTPAPAADTNWMVSCQRVLERHTARLANAPLESSAAGQAQQKGAEEALRYVKAIMEAPPGKEGA
jgi:hypothetical protein